MTQASYERPADVLIRDLGEELVLLNTQSERYHSLNDVGRRCYELLCAGQSIDSAVATISGEFDASEQVVRADVESLVPELVAAGLLNLSS